MRNTYLIFVLSILLIFTSGFCAGQKQPISIPNAAMVFKNLKADSPALREIKNLWTQSDSSAAVTALLKYFRDKMSGRYFFDWRNFKPRFFEYKSTYSEMFDRHEKEARSHMSRYAPETHWKLPFTNLCGKAVTAYELRHLSRQQKAYDMALMFWFNNEDMTYLDYWTRQMADLNHAYLAGEIDRGGNAVYEAFRAGKRINNWLFAHNAYLSSEKYSRAAQWLWLRTMLHHAMMEMQQTRKIKYGNHNTRGLVALFQLAVLFRDFKWADAWLKHSLDGLKWHLEKEILSDGMQFERSTHYHMGDIYNYFRVVQLAKINDILLPEIFDQRLRGMFDALVKLAHPNGKIPPLQDNTDIPYATYNDIATVMKLGELLYKNPVYGWFTSAAIPPDVYWLLRREQIRQNLKRPTRVPSVESVALKQSGYYVMRSGWRKNDLYLCVSAGLSEYKPDHQHGDMLGITAWANGHEILPNYQVKYKETNFKDFKNSLSKNVALVDSILQGRRWTPNRGGSGFGKFHFLPTPQVHAWINETDFDYFSGSHNGFDSLGVNYTREVIFVKDGFWIVLDHFESQTTHDYQLIWQGVFTPQDKSDRLRKRYEDGSGCDLILPGAFSRQISYGRIGGKKYTVITMRKPGNFTFVTVILPFIDTAQARELPGGWSFLQQNDGSFEFQNEKGRILLIGTKRIEGRLLLDQAGTFCLAQGNGKRNIQFLGPAACRVKQTVKVKRIGDVPLQNNERLSPGTRLQLIPDE